MATSLDISENEVPIDHLIKTLSFGEKIAKIDPADPEIICLREIIKDEREKKEKINARKIYSPVGNLAERAKQLVYQQTYQLHCISSTLIMQTRLVNESR